MRIFQAAGGLLMYVAAGLLALTLAAGLSSKFMPRAHSQTPGDVPPPAGDMGAPPPPGAPPQGAPDANGATGAAGAAGANANPNPSPLANPFDDKKGAKTPAKKGPTLLSDIIEDYTYQGREKRDPFQPFERPHVSGGFLGPLWPLQKFDLDQLKLVGIIWDVKSPKAMIIDPTGKGYVVRVNERIGRNNGYIARIREGEIVIVESFTGTDGKLNYQTKLIKLQTE